MTTAEATLLPKEHGAYGQMAVPLVTATAVSGPSPLAVAIVAGFLAHEPLLVLLGARGTRAKREAGSRAARWLTALGVCVGGAGLLALMQTPPELRWTFLLPLAPAVTLAREVWRQRPKSTTAELSAAAAFSLAAVPTVTSTGAPMATALSVALPFLVVFAAATLAVRGVMRGAREAGDPTAIIRLRYAPVFTALGGCTALALAAQATWLPWSASAAALPGAAVAAGVALAPPHPRQVKRLGWLIVGASLTASAVLVMMG
ncbi:MAG: YwiC-like family protein [Acidobacteria bacterium]|nr:YwiC-like family protein [Acidobacteriota bacterium]